MESDTDQGVDPERKLLQTIKSRKGKLGALTRKKNEVLHMIKTNEDKENVSKHLDTFNKLLTNFMDLQVDVQSLLEVDEREVDHTHWYEPKLIEFKEFLTTVRLWMCEDDDGEESREEVDNINALSEQVDNDDEEQACSEIGRSASQVSLCASGSKSLTTACVEAEAERAALSIKVKTLEQKHALDMEEAKIKAKQETLALTAELAAAEAKAKVLRQAGAGSVSSKANSRTSQHRSALSQPPRAKMQNPQHRTPKSEPITAPINNRIHARTSSPENVVDVLKRQNDITEILIKQQKASLLPVREIPSFDGDPLHFHSFIRAFEHGIENKTDNMQDRLYYLEQYTVGQPRQIVRSCQHMDVESGYNEARKQLEWHFGNKMKITMEFMSKTLNWTAIKAEDGPALRAYSIFLRSCYNTLSGIDYVEELENAANLRIIASKLPFKLRDNWRTVVCDIQERQCRRPKFEDLLQFIEKKTRALLDPMFGEINMPLSVKNRVSKVPQSRGSSFATTVTPVFENAKNRMEVEHKQITRNAIKRPCLFCSKDHSMETCMLFKGKPNKEKVEFMRANGLCFGCLEKGHMSKYCKNRMTCKACHKTHPTILHIETKDSQREQPARMQLIEASMSSALVSLKAGSHTGAGIKESALSIVPVKVKLGKGTKTVQTYAFLDGGSTATFCTEELMQQLNANGRKQDILLRTMGQEKPVSIGRLEVAALKGNGYLKLPDVYTHKSIPVTQENIPKNEDIRKWPYLDEVDLTPIDASIGLLIGVNAPKAMEPWRVINSEGIGPYAVKTRLGWVVNGPLNMTGDGSAAAGTVQVNRISVEDLLVQQYNQDFVEQHYEGKKVMSVEDQRFMDKVSSSAVLENGHYSLKLPFRKDNVNLPNNKAVAQQRAQHLLKKFKKDLKFFNEYKEFMKDVVAKGYAEVIPQDQLEHKSGKAWFIPHHGVYHPRKRTLRVVFDCASVYGGTSLNKELLQGPDLTNSLVGVLLRFRQGPIAIMTDIEGMFHQVRVAKEDVNYLRFLWWPDGDVTQELVEHRMTVHIFGAVSSPSCATFALLKTADDNQNDYAAEIVNTIRQNFYVDDCLKAVSTVEQATYLYENLTNLCAKGGFRLNKWVSNHRSVLATIPEDQRAKGVKTLDLDKDQLPMGRALGAQWNVEQDTFTFSIEVKPHSVTRRGILSIVSSIYDPLGFLAPVILPARQILQGLCKTKLGWDDQIPQEMAQVWQKWLSSLTLLDAFNITRSFAPKHFGAIAAAQLHHFCDASEMGYGSVSYLRLMNTRREMSDLPADRIIADLPPFTDVGIDYFGPMEVKRG
ncbi:hypothetical protein N1851_019297 [Merluccius polli]|uniref:CCHC-type domain-containing protein n=1 Tax=Merluccius polli TaxID=89951 RepID=A0AA47MMG7_MERPO|nr:hypothetical protein N1851_019297 [Merluccius polli]